MNYFTQQYVTFPLDWFIFLQAVSECGQSIKSTGSDRQEWSYTLYDFEGQGQVTRDVSFLCP